MLITNHGEAVVATNNVENNAAVSNVVNIRSARKAQEKAQQELMDYMIWTMKHDMDPHRLHDDPIAVFRDEMNARIKSA